jgi:hypothetical protein
MLVSRLPLYLRSNNNLDKEITVGSLVLNPNVDFKIYKVVSLSQKHILAVDEKLVLHKFKIKNFVNVDYVFNISPDILIAKNIQSTTLKISEYLYKICDKNLENNAYTEIFNYENNFNIRNEKLIISTKIIITKNKNSYFEHIDKSDGSISVLDHYATLKMKDSNNKIYVSLIRNFSVQNP